MSNTLVKMEELKHYGILGMRWGTRRFQNRDGTLTRAGIKRYGESEETATDKQKKARDTEKARSLNTLRRYTGNKATDITNLSEKGQNALANYEVSRSRRAFASDILLTPTVYSMPVRAGMAIKRQEAGQKFAEYLMFNKDVADMPYSEVRRLASYMLKDDAKARKRGLLNIDNDI